MIYCVDPRASEIPEAVAKEFGEIYPGENKYNEKGEKVGSTRTLATAITIGGRAIDARRTFAVLNHIFGLKYVVIVHHTYCGSSAFTNDGIIDAYKHEHHLELEGTFERSDLAITSFEESLAHDVKVMRDSPGTPKHIDIFGYVYDIDRGTLVRVVEDLGIR